MPGVRLDPAVLAPTPENADFVVGLVREQMEAVRSRTVNVGCDETFELGRGASKARADEIGVAAVYLEHLRRIVEPLLADGCSVQFWGDVLRTHPEELARLPGRRPHAAGVDLRRARTHPVPDIPPSVRALLDTMGVDARAADFADPRRAVRRGRHRLLGRARHLVVELAGRPPRERPGATCSTPRPPRSPPAPTGSW